jgi:hypothetical protein
LALTLLAVTQLHRVRFDYNLLNLQSQGLSAVAYERKLAESSARPVLPCLVTADSVDEAVALEQRLRALKTVATVQSMAPLLAGDQRVKLDYVRQIRQAAGVIGFAAMETGALDLSGLEGALQSFHQALGGALYALDRSAQPGLRSDVDVLREAVDAWRQAIRSTAPALAVDKLTAYQQALFGDLAATLRALQQQDDRSGLRAEDLPAGLRARFIGRTGKFLLHVYPKDNIWERAQQEAFVRDLRTVDPHVLGSPVRAYEYTRQIKSSFQKAALYALLLITIMLLSHFRNLACALMALMPVVVGILWTVGAMVLLDIPFNPANIISITLLTGIGVSSGVHILHRFTEEQHPTLLGRSTGKAALVSALTTAVGFGSLMLAKHEGIASLGKVMALGTVLCLLAALTVLPALLLLLKRLGLKLAHGWLSH